MCIYFKIQQQTCQVYEQNLGQLATGTSLKDPQMTVE